MTLSDASLAELVAELRKRLRPFMSDLSGAAGPSRGLFASGHRNQPGPLDPAGRASLSARLLAVVLGHRKDMASTEIANAFDRLAEALTAASAPLPDSELERSLIRLAAEFEALAMAWDRDAYHDLGSVWRSLRDLGDTLWSTEEPSAPPIVEGRAKPEPEDIPVQEIWLLVSGRMRRGMLRQRLEASGWPVTCPSDGAMAVTRLARERPAAFICDDAAPDRHGSRLRSLLPPESPPVILVRGRAADRGSHRDAMVWLPPYRTIELPAGLHKGEGPCAASF